MIQRWKLNRNIPQVTVSLYTDPTGEWVEYADHLDEIQQLTDRLALVEKERDEMKIAIDQFVNATGWADKMWKDQPHIKPLFDLIKRYQSAEHAIAEYEVERRR